MTEALRAAGEPAFADRAAAALRDEGVRRAVRGLGDLFPRARELALAQLENADELRDAARSIRARNLAQAPELLARFADRLEARGVHVFWAADGAEASGYVVEVARRHGVRVVAKSKSMATEEAGLNHVLEAAGVEVVETDLGEFIIQVAGEPPSHVIAPAIHHDRHGVARILSADAGRDLPPDPKDLCAYARERLRRVFLEAGVGVTGANFGVAETGTVVLVTNEGNGRMVTSLPKVHVAIMGLERIVETWEELDVLLALLPRSASGQAITVYTSLLSGPRASGEPDGPDEMHVVILDNGRSGVLASEFREILHCIRCGACLNVCPVYRNVGGHAYGSVYAGPVGAVLTPLLRRDRADLSHASSLCAACHEVCPVRIPLQDLLLGLRARDASGGAERLAFRAWARAWSHPAGYRWSVRAARLAARAGRRVPPRARTWLGSRLPGVARGWSAARDTPHPAPRTFLEGYRRR